MTYATQASGAEDSRIVVSNSLILLARRVIFWVLNGILLLFLPRYLGDQGLGQLAFAQSFAMLFTTVLSLGLGMFLVKEIARNRSFIETHLGAAIGIRVLTSVVVAGLVVGITQLTTFSTDAETVMYIAATATVALSFVRLADSALAGMENMAWLAFADIVGRLVVLTAGIVVLVQGLGVVAYAIVLVAANLVNLGLVSGYLARRVRVRINFEYPRIKTLLIGGAPFILMGFLLDVYNQTDTIVLRIVAGEAVVGWYAAASQIFKTVSMLAFVFTTALFPTLSRVHASGLDASIGMARKSLMIGALGIVPMSVGISLFSHEIISNLPYPDEFQKSIPLLTILGLTIPLTAFLMILGTIAIATDRQKAWAMALLATVVLNVVLNVIAAPYFQSHYGNGGIGVALTTLVSEMFMVLIGIRLMPKGVLSHAVAITLLKVFVATGVMALVVVVARNAGLPTVPVVATGVLVYGVLVPATRAVSREDLRFVKEFIVRNLREITTSKVQ